MTAASDAGAEAALWREFATLPGRYADRTRIAACFGDGFAIDFCERLRNCLRLQARLSDLVRAHYGLAPWVSPDDCDAADRTIALTPSKELEDLALRCGAIFCSSIIANVVTAQEVSVLQRQLDERLCAFALAHRDLAGPAKSIRPLEGLRAGVTKTGLLCLGAWCHGQSKEVGTRVRLKLAASDALDNVPKGPFAELGRAIVRRAAG